MLSGVGLEVSGSGWLLHASCSKRPAPVVGSAPLGPDSSQSHGSSSLQKDAPQSSWASREKSAPSKVEDAPLSQRPLNEELAKSSLATQEAALPEEASVPGEAGTADPTKDPDGPMDSPPNPTNGDQAQPSPVVQPGTSA